jgi:hypothetical protein
MLEPSKKSRPIGFTADLSDLMGDSVGICSKVPGLQSVAIARERRMSSSAAHRSADSLEFDLADRRNHPAPP